MNLIYDTTHEIPDKLGFIKIKNFCSAKDGIKNNRRQAIDWEKILEKIQLMRGYHLKPTKTSKT